MARPPHDATDAIIPSVVVLEVAEVGIIGGVGVADVFTTVVDGVGVADVGGVFTSVVAVGLADIAVVDDIVGVDIGIDEFEGGTMGEILSIEYGIESDGINFTCNSYSLNL